MKVKSKKAKILRPLTKKEKILLTILGALIIYFIFYRFVFQRQSDKIESLEEASYQLDQKIAENNRILRNELQIKEDWKNLREERDSILSNYFPVIDQSQIIYLLEELLVDEAIDVSDFRFSRPDLISVADREIAKMDISLPFEGEYNDIIKALQAIQMSPKKILFSSLQFTRDTNNILTGEMILNVISLEGLVAADGQVIYVETIDGNMDNPFLPYGDYREPVRQEDVEDKGEEDENKPEEDIEEALPSELDNKKDESKLEMGSLLYSFQNKEYEFLTNETSIEGLVSPSKMSRLGDTALRLDYQVDKAKDDGFGYIDLDKEHITVKSPVDFLNMGIYSYGANPSQIGLTLMDKNDKSMTLRASEKVDWTGWKDLKVQLPDNKALYPLKVKNIYIKLPKNSQFEATLIFDNLHLYDDYFTYKVKAGDTIFDISLKFYGTSKYMNEILRLNNMNITDILPVGKLLKLRVP